LDASRSIHSSHINDPDSYRLLANLIHRFVGVLARQA
jgi:hypothetical protein